MTEEQLNQAISLRQEKHKIEEEIEIWESDLAYPERLGYLRRYSDSYSRRADELNTNIPSEIFHGFRIAALNALRLRLSEIEEEFSEI